MLVNHHVDKVHAMLIGEEREERDLLKTLCNCGVSLAHSSHGPDSWTNPRIHIKECPPIQTFLAFSSIVVSESSRLTEIRPRRPITVPCETVKPAGAAPIPMSH